MLVQAPGKVTAVAVALESSQAGGVVSWSEPAARMVALLGDVQKPADEGSLALQVPLLVAVLVAVPGAAQPVAAPVGATEVAMLARTSRNQSQLAFPKRKTERIVRE